MHRSSDLSYLSERLGAVQLQKRLQQQVLLESAYMSRRLRAITRDTRWGILPLVEWGLKASGLYTRGRENAQRISITCNQLPFPIDGSVRVLHLGDLHFREGDNFAPIVCRALEALRGCYDLCVMSGDYRFAHRGPHQAAMKAMEQVRKAIEGPIYAVLGNHDVLEMVPCLESMDISVLLNESRKIDINGSSFSIIGTDDPHLYKTHDLKQAMHGIAENTPRLLLAHSPALYKSAAHGTCDLLLCGHTHGGQICLPGGIPFITSAPVPRRLAAGSWEILGLHGYTLRGTGCSGIPVRYFCAPEIAIHTLRRG